VGGLAYTKCKVSCATTHCADKQPVTRCAGILVNGAGNVRAFLLGRIESKCRCIVGQGQVVIDGLGDVYIGDRILLGLEEFGDTVGRRSGIVATYGDKQLDIVLLEELQVKALLEIFVRGFETAHLKIGTAPVEIRISLEEIDVLDTGIIVEEAAVSTVQTYNAIAAFDECFGNGANDGIHARSGPATAKDNDGIFHFTNCIF
jgi:hypothetical protein